MGQWEAALEDALEAERVKPGWTQVISGGQACWWQADLRCAAGRCAAGRCAAGHVNLLTQRDGLLMFGGAVGGEGDLGVNYTTICDPRLNARQSLDLSFRVAELLRAGADPGARCVLRT